jgi:hypothetical protein
LLKIFCQLYFKGFKQNLAAELIGNFYTILHPIKVAIFVDS